MLRPLLICCAIVDRLLGKCDVPTIFVAGPEGYNLAFCLLFYCSEEAQEYINIGAINSLFVLGRSIGFIGHYMDQKRLKQGLYRHPWDDISYVLPEQFN